MTWNRYLSRKTDEGHHKDMAHNIKEATDKMVANKMVTDRMVTNNLGTDNLGTDKTAIDQMATDRTITDKIASEIEMVTAIMAVLIVDLGTTVMTSISKVREATLTAEREIETEIIAHRTFRTHVCQGGAQEDRRNVIYVMKGIGYQNVQR